MSKPTFVPQMSPHDLVASTKKFPSLRVLIVGDLFLDEYIESEMYEVSKEGPIPVVSLRSRIQTAGAAGNLACSIRNLGAKVSMVSIIGKDPNGAVLSSQLKAKGIKVKGVIVDPRKPTLTYSKLRAKVENTPSREILRMDVLPDAPLTPRMEERVLATVRREAAGVDAIVVLDQIRHLITKSLLKELPSIAKERGALLHGSSRDHLADFRGFDLITPNDREACQAVGRDLSNVSRLGKLLQKKGRHKKILLTLGAEGMAAFSPKGPVLRLPTYASNVVDVTGAGDALSSVVVLGNILGWELGSLGWAASHAAAIAIGHVGTHHVTLEELKQRMLA